MFINKSNSIIQNSSFNLDTIELKVLSKIISMINSKSETFQYYYEFELKDFKNELSLHETNYVQLKDAVRQLSNKGFEIIKNNNIEVYSRWISSVITEKGTGNIRVEIPKEMKEYYLNLNEKYTSVKAIYIYKLRSKYSIRLYELLSSWKTKGNITYTLEELKKMFKINSKYKRFYDFKRKVIEVAQKEFIKKEIDINFTYKSSGRGTNKKIFFEVIDMTKEREKEEAKRKQELINNSDNIDKQIYTDIETTLEKMGFNEKERNKLISEHDEMKLRRNINYTLEADKNKKVKTHIKAFLRSALKADYAMNSYEQKQEYQKDKVKNAPSPLPIVNQEPQKEVSKIDKQKEKLKTNNALYQEFIKFIAEIARNKPSGRASVILPNLISDSSSIDTTPFIDKFIDKFFKTIVKIK
jgi:plasmid replication initiation protein